MSVIGALASPEVQRNVYNASLAVPSSYGWAETARRCTRFLEGDQWEAWERDLRKQQKRTTLTFNRVRPLWRLVYGWFCSQRMDVTFRPGNDWSASDDVAEILSKLFKNICDRNQWEFLQTDVFLDGLTTGRGWADIRADFGRNFMGDIKLSVRDPFTVFPDPEASSYDPADWGYVVETRWLSLDDILVYYGKIARKKVDTLGNTTLDARFRDGWWETSAVSPETYFGLLEGWQRGEDKVPTVWGGGTYGSNMQLDMIDPARKLVRVIDCQWKELKRRRWFVDCETGQESYIPEDMPREKVFNLLQLANQVYQEQGMGSPVAVMEGPRYVWNWTITAGDQLLYDAPSIYEAPTQVLYSPYFRRGITHGMLNDLIDPQEEINRRRNAVMEILARTANGGWMYPEGSLDPEEEQNLQEYGSTPGVHVKYRSGFDPPQPIKIEPVQAAHAQLGEMANADLKEISNVNDSLLGNLDKVQSGRAILNRQRGGLTSIQSYQDQMRRTLLLMGQRGHHLIKTLYTEQRIFRERGEDGQDTPYVVNRRMADGLIVNDVTSGSYDVTVDTSPETATFQDAAFETLLEMIEKGIPIPSRYVLKNAPVPDKREMIDAIEQQAAEAAAAGMGVGPGAKQPPPLPGGGNGANIRPGGPAPGGALGS